MKDGHIFSALDRALDAETTVAESRRLREDVLKRFGSKSAAYDFVRLLLVKTSSVRLACSPSSHTRFPD
jgi:hypothetical protein